MWSPDTLEFQVISNPTDAIVTPIASGVFTRANTSALWSIEDVRLVADIVTLASGLQNNYAEWITSGKTLPVNYSTYIYMIQAVKGPNINVSVARAVSRLKTTFFNCGVDHSTINPALVKSSAVKDFNSCVHPMEGASDSSKEVEWQLHIGSKMFPAYPCRSLAQSFHELKKALGSVPSSFHSISPTRDMRMNDHFYRRR